MTYFKKVQSPRGLEMYLLSSIDGDDFPYVAVDIATIGTGNANILIEEMNSLIEQARRLRAREYSDWVFDDMRGHTDEEEINYAISEMGDGFGDSGIERAIRRAQEELVNRQIKANERPRELTYIEKMRREFKAARAFREVGGRDGYKCALCGSVEKLEVDHIIPLAKGGTNDLENLQILCKPCNRSKGAKICQTSQNETS